MDERNGRELVPVEAGTAAVAVRELWLPALVVRAREAARYAAEEFLSGRKSIHTRAAYERAVRKFLEWCDGEGSSSTPFDRCT